MSEERKFTIERVEIRPIDKTLFLPGEEPPFDHRAVLFGRMEDGRAFVNEQWITDEALKDIGEEKLIQSMREAVHVPEESDWRDHYGAENG